MRERIEALVGGRAKTMWISTFHSSCVRILRREAKNVGLNSNFSIYDSADSLRLITLVAKNLDLDPKRFAPKAIQHKISALKNELIDADSYSSSANYNDPFEQAVAEVFKGYSQRLRQANAMDFDDLIAETVYMFRAFPALADSYRRRFRHVLVDEYQDTNHAQYALVREIVGEGPDVAELTVVGDSDQSIYGLRGAEIHNILEFENDYPDACKSSSWSRTTAPPRPSSTPPTASSATTRRHRQDALDRQRRRREIVADRRRERARRGASSSSRGSTGCRTQRQPAPRRLRHPLPLQRPEPGLRGEVLRARASPTWWSAARSFYERKEIKDAIAYLRVIDNPGRRRLAPQDPQLPQARHRRPGRGRRRRSCRAGAHLLHGRREARRRGTGHGDPLGQRRAGLRETPRRPRRGGLRLRRGRRPGSRAGTDRVPRGAALQHGPPGRIAGGEPRGAGRRRPGIRTRQPRRLARSLSGTGLPGGRRRPDPGRARGTISTPPSPKPSASAS